MKRIPGIILSLALVASLGAGLASCSPGSSLTPSGSATPPVSPNPGGSPSTVVSKGALEVRVTDAPPGEDVTSIMLTVSKLAIHRAVPGEKLEESPTPTATVSPTPTATVTPTPTNATATPTATTTPVANETVTPIATTTPVASVTTTPVVNATVTPTVIPPPSPKENDTGWTTVKITGNQTFDLLKLRGVEQILGNQTLEPGKYTQVRLTVDKAMVAVGNKTAEEATIPSGELKFVHPFDIVANQTTVIVMDFDAEKSVNISGNGKIMIKPVVKLLTKDDKIKDNKTGTPTVTPSVTPASTANFTVGITVSGTVLSGGDTTPEGLLDVPHKFVYRIEQADGTTVGVTYTAYPPSPVGDKENAKIKLTFHGGSIQAGQYLEARGTLDKDISLLTVASEGDYIKTFAAKP
jgi:hypothetical protein